jgi:multidrug efflux pump subunit AcrA (membrane-fusion protein)
LKLAQAQRDLAQATYTRYDTLYKQGFESAQDVDTQAAGLKTATATVVSAESGVSAAQSDVASAQQAVSAAQASAESANANIDASRKNLAANQAALTTTIAAVKYARQNILFSAATVQANRAAVDASQANQQRYEVMQGFENVVAPFDGVITARNVDVGTLIVADSNNGVLGAPSTSGTTATGGMPTTAPSTGMFGIARTDSVRIDVSVPQTYVPTLRAGSSADVTVQEIAGQVFHGMVTLRSGAMDTASRTQLVEIILPNPKQELVPGMYANVEINPVRPLMTLRIPGTALIADSEGTRVAEVSRAGKVHFQAVTVGRDFGTEMEIVSGLAGRERLIDNPSDLLQEGAIVKAVKSTRPRRKHAPALGRTKPAGKAVGSRGKAAVKAAPTP